MAIKWNMIQKAIPKGDQYEHQQYENSCLIFAHWNYANISFEETILIFPWVGHKQHLYIFHWEKNCFSFYISVSFNKWCHQLVSNWRSTGQGADRAHPCCPRAPILAGPWVAAGSPLYNLGFQKLSTIQQKIVNFKKFVDSKMSLHSNNVHEFQKNAREFGYWWIKFITWIEFAFYEHSFQIWWKNSQFKNIFWQIQMKFS